MRSRRQRLPELQPPEGLADDLNHHNDAYPLARPSQAAALATLQHEKKFRARLGLMGMPRRTMISSFP